MTQRLPVSLLLAALLATLLLLRCLAFGEVPILGDLFYYFLPFRASFASAGPWPLWDSSVLSGTSFVTNPQSALFWPPTWLFFVLPLPLAFTLQPWISLVLGGALMDGVLRLSGRSPTARVLGSVAFALGGAMVSLVTKPDKMPAYALLSGLAWACLSIGRGNPRAFMGLALCGAGMILSGGVEIAVLAVPVGLFCLWLGGTEGTSGRGVAARFSSLAMGGLLGIGLSAAAWIPFLEWLPYTDRSQGLSHKDLLERALHLVDALCVVLPNPFLNPLTHEYSPGGGPARKIFLDSLYLGIFPMALAVMAPVWSKTPMGRARVWGLWGMALLFALLALGGTTPLYDLLLSLPGMNAIRYPSKWWLGSAFFLCWLLAEGWDGAEQAPVASRWLGGLLAAVAMVTVGMDLGVESGNLSGVFLQLAPALRAALPFALLPVGVLHLGGRGRISLPLARGMVVMVVGVDLLLRAMPQVPTADPAVLFARTPLASGISSEKSSITPRIYEDSLHTRNQLPKGATTVAEQYDRLLAVEYPNLGVLHGLRYVDGSRELRARRQAEFLGFAARQPIPARARLLRVLGVRAITFYLRGDGASWEGVPGVGEVQGVPLDRAAWRSFEGAPELRFVSQSRLFPNPAAAFSALANGAVDPVGAVTLIAGDPGVEEGQRLLLQGPSGREGEDPSRLREVQRSPGRAEAVLAKGGPGWLVMAEGWAPGWRARWNGEELPVARGDYFLLAVPVPASEEGSLELTYEPPSLRAGMGISLVSLLLLFLLARRTRALAGKPGPIES